MFVADIHCFFSWKYCSWQVKISCKLLYPQRKQKCCVQNIDQNIDLTYYQSWSSSVKLMHRRLNSLLDRFNILYKHLLYLYICYFDNVHFASLLNHNRTLSIEHMNSYFIFSCDVHLSQMGHILWFDLLAYQSTPTKFSKYLNA